MVVKMCLAAIILFTYIHCVTIVMERANVTSCSEKYFNYSIMYVTRKSRKSPYYLNIEAQTKLTFGNNVTGHVIFYEYLHNEYRRTFIEIHSPLCDILHKDPFIGGMFRDKGVICPVPMTNFHLLNMTVPTKEFRYKVPFEKFRVDIELEQAETKETMAKGYVYARFRDN